MLDKVIEFLKDPANIAFVAACVVAVLLIVIVCIATSASRAAKKKKAKAAAAVENTNVQEVVEEPAVEEVAEEPVVEEVAEEPVVEEVVEEPVVEEVVEEPVVEEPVVEEVVEEPVVEEPVVEEVVEEPVVEEVVEEPAVEEVVEEPVAEEVAEEPVAEEVAEEPVVEEVAEEPVAEEVVEEPVVEEVVEEPVVEEQPKPKRTRKPAVKKETTEEPVVEEQPKPKKTTKKAPAKQEVVEEPVVEEVADEAKKGRTYNGKYEVYPNGDGYQYRLKASNGEILIVSENFVSRENVLKAIDAVRRNIVDGQLKIIEDKHGKFKFKLISKNYRVIALGSNYTTEKSAVRASESFKKFALKADVVEIETPVDKESLAATPVDLGVIEDRNGGKYIVEKFNGEFSWSLRANNGQVLVQVEGYTTKNSILNSIETFKKNASNGTFKIVKDKNDNYHFRLYSAAGRVAAIGETYGSKQLAESAAISVASYFKNSEVIEAKPEEKE